MDWGFLSDCARDDGLGHVVEVTAALLRVANATPAETSADFREAGLENAREVLRSRLAAIMPTPASEFVTAPTLAAIADALTATPLREGFAALTAAQVLDAWCGHRFIDYFRGARDRLEPGDPIPAIGFPASTLPDRGKAVLGALGRPTSRPHNLTPVDDRTPRLRLAPPEVERFRVGLRWAEPHLAPIDASWRFAAAVTNHDLTTEFQVHRYDAGGRRVFYPVTPTDDAGQRARIERAIAEAIAKRATVLVLPELTTTKAIVDELIATAALRSVPLCALGSYHEPVPVGSPGHNRCRVLAHGVELATHDKFSDYRDADDHQEHLVADTRAGFDMLVAAGAALIVLICKDALDERVTTLVQRLGPTLVLIPAMSTKTRPFETFAERLADVPQAFSLISSASGEHAAIFGRPGATSDRPPVVKHNHPEPKVFVFGVGGDEVD